MDLIVRKDLRALLGPVRDQGRRPTCLAFATSACHEHAHGRLEPFSAEWIYFHAVRRDGGHPDEGCSPDGICAAVGHDGQPLEANCPYQATNVAGWQPMAGMPDLFRADEVKCALGFEEIVAKLEQEQPVVLGLLIGDSFQEPEIRDVHALILEDASDPDPSSGHAVLAVGVGTLDGVDMLLVRNSWGARWGDAGYAWLSRTYCEARAIAAFGLSARL